MEFFEKKDVKVIREDNFKNEMNIESESLINERFVTRSKDSNSFDKLRRMEILKGLGLLKKLLMMILTGYLGLPLLGKRGPGPRFSIC